MQDIADEFYSHSDMGLCNALMQAEQEHGEEKNWPDWFEGRKNRSGHIAAICPISTLGYSFMNGRPYSPVNVEKTFLAALFVDLSKKVKSNYMDKYLYRDFAKALESLGFYKDGTWIDISEI